jgi:cell division GTPase FtsZ
MKEHNEIFMRGGMIMSEKKLSQEELLRRIDELLSVLNMISRDLTDVTKTLKETGVSAATVAPAEARTIESVQTWFPKNLEEMLTFEDAEDYIMIKPRQYLGSENFAKIASIVRDNGGEYISAGKESHFRVSK